MAEVMEHMYNGTRALGWESGGFGCGCRASDKSFNLFEPQFSGDQ